MGEQYEQVKDRKEARRKKQDEGEGNNKVMIKTRMRMWKKKARSEDAGNQQTGAVKYVCLCNEVLKCVEEF